MKNQNKHPQSHTLLLGIFLPILFSSFGFSIHEARAETFPITLTCAPDFSGDSTAKGEQFTLIPGKALTVSCTAKNTSDTSFSAFLLGKQTDTQKNSAASSSEMTMSAHASTKATLQFPAVFQSGSYYYSFTLLDIKTHLAIAKEARLTGIIAGNEEARIVTVTMGQEKYEWQAPASLKLFIAIPKDTPPDDSQHSLEIFMQDANGKPCKMLVKNTPVKRMDDTYQFNFPAAGSCINAIQVVLKNKDGKILDQKVLAVNLSETNPSASTKTEIEQGVAPANPLMSSLFTVGLALTVVVLLALGGFYFIRRRR